MAGVYDATSEAYAKKRPQYPREWFVTLSSLTSSRQRAWDAGCGSGQASVSVAEFYESVVATDVSEAQLKQAAAHPKVRYVHTKEDISEDDLVELIGGEGSMDLVVAATAVHWFDLLKFYAVVKRVLKPGGVVAVWGYNLEIDPFGRKIQEQLDAAIGPSIDPRARLALDRYNHLPFPFQPIGLGCEGKPADMDMDVSMTHNDLVQFLMTFSVMGKAREMGLERDVLSGLEEHWEGQPTVEKKLALKAFMLAGKPI